MKIVFAVSKPKINGFYVAPKANLAPAGGALVLKGTITVNTVKLFHQ
jgi:hypothetical protein